MICPQHGVVVNMLRGYKKGQKYLSEEFFLLNSVKFTDFSLD